jgi:hypothetical protein
VNKIGCKFCKYSRPVQSESDKVVSIKKGQKIFASDKVVASEYGCVRYPPSITSDGTPRIPVLSFDFWCGEFKKKSTTPD